MPFATVRYFVSDRAKALVNLATNIYNVTSVADCFHFKYCINHLLCLALATKLRCSKSRFEDALNTHTGQQQVIYAADKYAEIQFSIDLYVETMQNVSHCIHPYHKGNRNNSLQRAAGEINKGLENIAQIIESCQIKDKYGLFQKAQQQVPQVAAVISEWHQMKDEKCAEMKLPGDLSEWFEGYLLPKTYWETALKRTKHRPTRELYKKELQEIELCKKQQGKTGDMPLCIIEALKEKAVEICRKFQRASSQVEGRNGFLSAINHNQRSFDSQRLKVLTVVHNFDTRGLDGKLPAERLFGKNMEFPSLFEYIVDNFGELPRSRTKT